MDERVQNSDLGTEALAIMGASRVEDLKADAAELSRLFKSLAPADRAWLVTLMWGDHD